MKNIKVISLTEFLIIIFVSLNLYALSPEEIMQKVNERDDGNNRIADMKMILIDKKGHQRIRDIKNYSKNKGEDEARVMFFLTPKDVKDTAMLTMDYDDENKDDDQWLYLPALKKTKRIASTDKSGSFMGSDFNYSNMTRIPLARYNFKLLKEDSLNDHPVWMIEATPKTREEADNSGYKKRLLFIRKDNFVPVRGVFWVYGEDKIKYYDVKGLEIIDDIWTITEMHMTTKKGKQTKHKTILKFTNLSYNNDLKEDFFSIRQIEKGL